MDAGQTPPPSATPVVPEPTFGEYFVQDIESLKRDPVFQEHYPAVRLKLQNFLMNLQRKTCKRFEHDKTEAANRMLVYEEILDALTLVEAKPQGGAATVRKRPKLTQTDIT